MAEEERMTDVGYEIAVAKEEAAKEAAAEALAKGLAKGHAEGRLEERKEMARRMLAKSKPVAEIAEFTGLAESEILAI